MTAMIAVRHLTKRFGHLLAVDDISLDVARGEVLGFLGPNGSGKSTTMKMVTGFLTPTAGTAEVCGIDVRRDPIAAQRHFGYLPEGAPAYGDMTPASYLSFIADVRRLSGVSRRQAIDRVIAATHLDRVLQQPIDTLSKGYKRRVGVAQALIHDPDVLILDEPTDGLDPNQKHEVRSLIGEMAGSKAIIISTHILEEVDAVCSRAVIIAEGRIVADGTPDSLERRSPMHNAVRLVVPARSAEAARAGLVGLAGVLRVDVGAGAGDHAELCAFAAPDTEIIAAVAQLARDNGWNVHELRVERGRLDDVFRDITTGRAGAPRGNAHA
jgi:ABC-2 type transport system ATP-binding protein